MSKILNAIPPQGFELCRDRIANILIDEFESQRTLRTDEELHLQFFTERFNGLDKTEFSACNVSLSNGIYDNKSARSVDGTYQFTIDFYASAKSNASHDGDSLANIKLQKYLGICRAIFEAPVYNRLGFEPPSISRVWVSAIAIRDPEPTTDATSSVMGRLTLNVRMAETHELQVPVIAAGFDTKIKIEETEHKYYYSLQA